MTEEVRGLAIGAAIQCLRRDDSIGHVNDLITQINSLSNLELRADLLASLAFRLNRWRTP